MHPEFQTLVDRAARLRLTETEMREAARLPYVKYWRARESKVALPSIVKVIRTIEATLDRLEQLPAVCATCDRPRHDPATRACTAPNCGLSLKHSIGEVA